MEHNQIIRARKFCCHFYFCVDDLRGFS